MGTGHVMRCLALAQAWQDMGGTVSLLARDLPAALAARCGEEGVTVLPFDPVAPDGEQTAAAARAADWTVLDGYHFDAAFGEALARAARRLLVVDDLGLPVPGAAALVLNQNITADAGLYPPAAGGAGLLLGCRFALLRREFRAPPPVRDFAEPCRRVLVTLGGSDPQQVTGRVIAALRTLPGMEARIIVGAVNPRLEELRALCAESDGRLEILAGVRNMVPLMDWAQMAVSAGGTSVLELASRALPTLLITVADNQAAICALLAEAGVMRHAGWHHELDVSTLAAMMQGLAEDGPRRARMAELGRALVDGLGAVRVAGEMLARQAAEGIRLRRATLDDARLLLDWANDPVTREVSFQSGVIAWETHLPWLERRLASAQSLLLIAEESAGVPLGMVRFDIGDAAAAGATISINLAPAQRGRGLGPALILLGCRELRRAHGEMEIHAFIKPGNAASVRAFERAGFQPAAPADVAGQAALRMIQR